LAIGYWLLAIGYWLLVIRFFIHDKKQQAIINDIFNTKDTFIETFEHFYL